MLDVQGLTVRYGARTVVDRVSFHVSEGQWLMLVGPNGAGKSTIVNAVSQGVPYAGEVQIGGRNAASYSPRALARRLGVLMQSQQVSYAFTVEEIVRLGRYAFAPSAFSASGGGDSEAVERALEAVGMRELRSRSVLRLSGGELQRAFLAQLLAQDPPLMLLDEPTNALDLPYQRAVFSLLTEWRQSPGRAIVSVVHDISLAAKYGTHALLLDGGKTIACGGIRDTLCEKNLARAYGMNVRAWMRELLSLWNEEAGGNTDGI